MPRGTRLSSTCSGFTLFPSHQFYFLSAAAFCVCSPVNCLSSFFQGPHLFRRELSCKQFQNCCQLVTKWQLFRRFVTVKAFSSRQEHASLAFVFSFQLVNSSCWRLFEILTCWIRIKLANIFKTARHVEQTEATSFPWRHVSVCSLIDHGQRPITARATFTLLHKLK